MRPNLGLVSHRQAAQGLRAPSANLCKTLSRPHPVTPPPGLVNRDTGTTPAFEEPTMTIRTTALALATAGMFAFGAAQAQPMMHHAGGGEMFEILHGLNLTEAQKSQIHTIMESAHSASKSTWQQMHAIHEQIVSGLLAGNTQDQLASLVQQEEQLRAQEDSAHLATAIQIRGVLTAEQLSKAASTHQQLEALHAQEHALQNDGAPE